MKRFKLSIHSSFAAAQTSEESPDRKSGALVGSFMIP
jgi:hypothetical protein